MSNLKECGLTERALDERLNIIRAAINALKRRDVSNVAFLNIDGFTRYVDDSLRDDRMPLAKTLKEVEPYIPLILSDDNLRFFLEAAVSNDEELLVDLERAFLNDAKARFVNSVYNAEDEAAWQSIVQTCRTIRSYREHI